MYNMKSNSIIGKKKPVPTVIKMKQSMPKDNSRIWFITKQGQKYNGLYIAQENMFFVGFEETSENFFFRFQIAFWGYLDETDKLEQKSKVSAQEKEHYKRIYVELSKIEDMFPRNSKNKVLVAIQKRMQEILYIIG